MPSCQCDRTIAKVLLPAVVGRQLGDSGTAAANIKYQQRGDDADHEHAAPADILEQQAVDDRSEKISGRIAGLQQSGYQTARLRRNGFHGQRRADAPFAAHGDAEDGAQDQERGEIRRETGCEFNRRIEQHVDHQSRPASPAIGSAAEDVGADRPHRQSEQDGEGDVGDLRAEFRRDVLEHENQEEKIESVERPTQKARRHDVLLFARPSRKRFDAHVGLPGRGLALDVGVGPIVAARQFFVPFSILVFPGNRPGFPGTCCSWAARWAALRAASWDGKGSEYTPSTR